MALNDKQQRFCEEYLIDLNATQAAIRAGYTPKTAVVQGSRLLTNANIQTYISDRQQQLQEKTGITQERVIAELAKIGFCNIQDYIGEGFTPLPLSTIDRSKADAIASIKKSVTEFDGGSKTTVELKLHDKLKSLELLGRHLGIFLKDNEQKIPPTDEKRPVVNLPDGTTIEL